jgi:soluble lytic murein transglycosylase-like protein
MPATLSLVLLAVISLIVGWKAVQSLAQEFGAVGSSVADLPTGITLSADYTVAPGDTLSGISRRFFLPVRVLSRANHISQTAWVYTGEVLHIPALYHPRKTQRLVEFTARTLGLDPAFADAIAYQESGFRESVTSSTGAIGVMQVEPDTGSLVAQQTGRTYDLRLESDNVSVGVYWLAYLVRYYGGDEHKAAAAYYEGQGNLAQHGYLRGTKLYVADVMALRERFASS